MISAAGVCSKLWGFLLHLPDIFPLLPNFSDAIKKIEDLDTFRMRNTLSPPLFSYTTLTKKPKDL